MCTCEREGKEARERKLNHSGASGLAEFMNNLDTKMNN